VKPVLGVDLGEARTGVALSDDLRMLAHPLETISNTSADKVAQRLRKIVAERQVDCVVVGLPRRMNGALGSAAENTLRFVEKLRSLVSCEVVTWDERLSTVAAERALRDAGKKTRETRAIRDQVAAQIILQSYLDRLNA
jgi:putative holliday junction resolvase